MGAILGRRLPALLVLGIIAMLALGCTGQESGMPSLRDGLPCERAELSVPPLIF